MSLAHWIQGKAEDGEALPQPRRWTADDYLRAAETGIFREDEKLELLFGEVYYKVSPQGVRHSQAIVRLTRWIIRSLPPELDFWSQASTRLSDWSVPEPDLAVLTKPTEELASLPTKDDILIVFEVSDSSLRVDRDTKARIYGEAGIQEYWVVNLRDDVIEVFREPNRDGYGWVKRYGPEESIQPPFPCPPVLVSSLIPKPL